MQKKDSLGEDRTQIKMKITGGRNEELVLPDSHVVRTCPEDIPKTVTEPGS
jgi:hypothetical protein